MISKLRSGLSDGERYANDLGSCIAKLKELGFSVDLYANDYRVDYYCDDVRCKITNEGVTLEINGVDVSGLCTGIQIRARPLYLPSLTPTLRINPDITVNDVDIDKAGIRRMRAEQMSINLVNGDFEVERDPHPKKDK